MKKLFFTIASDFTYINREAFINKGLFKRC